MRLAVVVDIADRAVAMPIVWRAGTLTLVVLGRPEPAAPVFNPHQLRQQSAYNIGRHHRIQSVIARVSIASMQEAAVPRTKHVALVHP